MKFINLTLLATLWIAAASSAAMPLHRERLPPSAVIDGQLYRGARLTPESLSLLQTLGIRTVINLQGGDLNNPGMRTIIRVWEPGEILENIESERTLVQDLGMQFMNIPINSLNRFTEQESGDVDRALAVMADPNAWPVYIHCEYGRDRTGLLIALFKVRYLGVDAGAAYQEWLAMGHTKLAQVFTHNLDRFFWTKIREWKRKSCAAELVVDETRSEISYRRLGRW